ncbi:hypothetical protein GHK86_08015 [Acidimicrobiaceae bacterium USS-CC1]|uniref:Uncharacterized protein n=1 Tax=Acidiferrimicrobium australe TaxID=2664430 RepID=A0ABW9QS42_9ACTN|nr:hypothetical protein [Acidiferrimicrobium australe]
MQDTVLVPRPVEDVVSALSSGCVALIGASLAGIDADAAEARGRVGPLRSPAGLGKTVEVRRGPLRRHGEATLLAFSWSATGGGALFPDLDGDLEIRPVELDRTLLTLRGRYEPPGGRIGQRMDHLVGHHLAEATIRAFLAALADRLTEGLSRTPCPDRKGAGPEGSTHQVF